MVKRINSSKDLPKWFDLKKYVNSENLSLADWHRQLKYRYDTFMEFDECGGILNENIVQEIRKTGIPIDLLYPDYPVTYIRTHPRSKKMQSLLQRREKYAHFRLLGNHAVNPLSTYTVAETGSWIKKEIKAHQDKEEIITHQDEMDRYLTREPFDAYLRRVQDKDPRAEIRYETGCVEIDMRLPDTEIIEQFRQFLPKYRKFLGISPIKKKPSPAIVSRLTEYNILAYLDLLIWEKEHNVLIKRSVLANAIFPDGSKGEIELNQTVKFFAQNVISLPFLNMLNHKVDESL